ncbi:hypothetical protein CGRA01v4_12074 [Colletotrichum graminicola]|nr:hypothetical protein CGRA01v4_12074 [Colletotrichum graminicola]
MVTRRRAPPETIVDFIPSSPLLPRLSFHSHFHSSTHTCICIWPCFRLRRLLRHRPHQTFNPAFVAVRTSFDPFYFILFSLFFFSFPSSLVTSHTTTAVTSCAYSSTRRAYPTDKTFPSFP